MKRTLSLIFLLLISAYSLAGQSIIRTPMGEILDDLSYFTSLYPRLEGSKEEKAAYLYIKKRLDADRISYTEKSLDELREAHSFSSSIIVDLPGRLPDTLNIVIPIDHHVRKQPGQDGSINIALGLALVREFAPRQLETGLRVLFLGAEFSGPEGRQLGSMEFLTDFFPEEPQAFLYLSMDGISDEILLRAGGEKIVAPYWFVERTIDALEESALAYRFKESENQIHRLGMWHASTRIDPYLQAGFPGLTLEGRSSPEALNSTRWVTSFFTFFFSLLERNERGFPGQWDRHYLYFNILGAPFSIGEGDYLYLLLALLLIPLGYPFFMSRRFTRYLRTFLRNFWDIPVLLIMVFLFLLIGTWGLRGLFQIRDFPELWRHMPFISLLIKGGLALLQFFLFFGLLKKLPFSRHSAFYSSSAIFLLMLAVTVIAFLDVTMTYSLLWAFAFSFLFTIISSRFGMSLCLLLSTLLVGKSFYDVFSEGAMTVIEFILLSPFWGNLFLALLILPFLLMVIRLDFLFRHPTYMQQKIILRNAGILASTATLIGILYLFGFSPYSETVPQPVEVIEKIDGNAQSRLVRIQSDAPIEALMLAGPGSPQSIITGVRQISFESPVDEELIQTEIERESFLDRERFLISLSARVPPEHILLQFSGRGEFLVYDVNFPFTLNPDRKSADIHIGRNPPLPLTVDIVFPASTVRSMRILAELSGPAPDLAALGGDYAIRHQREYRVVIPLSN